MGVGVGAALERMLQDMDLQTDIFKMSSFFTKGWQAKQYQVSNDCRGWAIKHE